jgi:hypothetical protein
MQTITFSPDELHVIRMALEIAAQQYSLDAATMRAAAMPPLAEQFVRQAERARKLYSRIEQES